MARDLAVIRTDMWGDGHWRSLTAPAQWLYEYLLTAPSLSHVGVADWRPGRIAKLARGLSSEKVAAYAVELVEERFLIIDEETEEVLVRSHLRHDGVLRNPNLWKSVGNAFAEVASPELADAVAVEARRLRDEHPDGLPTAKGGTVHPWSSRYLAALLKRGEKTPSDTPSQTPSDTPSPMVPTGGRTGAHRSDPDPEPRKTSSSSARKARETSLPKDWAPTVEHIERARLKSLDVIAEAERFRAHAEAHDRKAVRWNAAFTQWLLSPLAKPVVQDSSATIPKERF